MGESSRHSDQGCPTAAVLVVSSCLAHNLMQERCGLLLSCWSACPLSCVCCAGAVTVCLPCGLHRHPKFSKATNVSVTTNLTGTFGTSIPALQAAAAAGGGGPPVAFLPAPGDHLMTYKGRWMLISRQRTSGNPQLAANARCVQVLWQHRGR